MGKGIAIEQYRPFILDSRLVIVKVSVPVKLPYPTQGFMGYFCPSCGIAKKIGEFPVIIPIKRVVIKSWIPEVLKLLQVTVQYDPVSKFRSKKANGQ